MSQLHSNFAALGLLGLALASSPAQAGFPSTVYVSATAVCDYPTIQAAILDLVPGSEIRLVGAEFELGASLSIFNRSLRIAGGYPACGAPAPAGKTTLRADFAGAPVVSVGANLPGALNLDLVDLVITGGDNPTGNGGGLQVAGLGQVNLIAVDIHDNNADFGGGVYVAALSGGPLAVNLLNGTRIGNDTGSGNTAQFGGGVFCSGARMRLGHADIMSNEASGEGGGLRVFDCEILSTEADGDLRIEHNRARDGGGIYANNQSQLTLRSRPQQRISISHNEAIVGAPPRRGGGVYLAGIGTRLDASGVRIDNNIARTFAAGLLLQGAEAFLDRGIDGCAVGDVGCSSLSGNEVRDDAGMLTGSAAAAFVGGGGAPHLSLLQTRVVGNAAGSSILAVGDSSLLELSNVLVAANQSNGGLINTSSTGVLRGDFVTMVDNLFAGAAFNNASTAPLALELQRSIVLVEAGNAHLSGAGTTAFACLNTGAGGALGGTAHSPGFFDAAAGNYLLRSDSENLDRCAVDGNEPDVDLAGRPRVVDRPAVANGAGPVDRGAFEDVEDLFGNGFED